MPKSPETVTDKRRIAELLEEMALMLELSGANPFKSRAFRNAAPVIKSLTDDLEERVINGTLTDIKGIGEGIARVISSFVQKGRSKDYDELKKSIPDGLLAMTTIRGLGPKRAKMLYDTLGIDGLEALEKACRAHKISVLDGFGTKTEDAILAGLEETRRFSDQHLYPVGRETADAFLEVLRPLAVKGMAEVAGSVRRCKEVIKDIDIVAASAPANRAKILTAFTRHKIVGEVIAKGDTKVTVRTIDGVLCDLRVVEPKQFPFALNYFTGSKEHNIEVRSRARKKGLSLNEYGFTRLEGKARVRIPPVGSEADLYACLGLSYIEPELRENMGEFDGARSKAMPALVELKDLRGTFHCHTTASDGSHSLEEMAAAARKKGWEYWGVADHSKAAAYARGLTHERVLQQVKEVDALNARSKSFHVFKGTECDILTDGDLDFPAKTLALLDYVVVSVHSKFTMTEAEATKRVVKALRNRHTTILGHPTGRLLLERDGYPIDLRQVIDAASDHGKAIEINAHPLRLDLDWRWLRYALEKQVSIVINPDAHSISGLDDVQYGVGIARKGGLQPKHIVNTWPVQQVVKFFEDVRR